MIIFKSTREIWSIKDFNRSNRSTIIVDTNICKRKKDTNQRTKTGRKEGETDRWLSGELIRHFCQMKKIRSFNSHLIEGRWRNISQLKNQSFTKRRFPSPFLHRRFIPRILQRKKDSKIDFISSSEDRLDNNDEDNPIGKHSQRSIHRRENSNRSNRTDECPHSLRLDRWRSSDLHQDQRSNWIKLESKEDEKTLFHSIHF